MSESYPQGDRKPFARVEFNDRDGWWIADPADGCVLFGPVWSLGAISRWGADHHYDLAYAKRPAPIKGRAAKREG